MHIVGGLYREICHIPAWNTIFGSGGRAGAAISRLSPGSTLYAYTEDFDNERVVSLRRLGIQTKLRSRPTSIVFAYFHPLSTPYVEPSIADIPRQFPLHVSGDAVLRFGFLEGDAIVNANRAVYDPQTWRNPAPFGANGSTAEELAIVLNEFELKALGGEDELAGAARKVLAQQEASIVIAKGGIWGATLYERDQDPFHIPAYYSSRIFKIGTGDIFSAVFTHLWAERRLPARAAADTASRAVSTYCSSGRLPLALDTQLNQVAVQSRTKSVVHLEGAIDSIGSRYAMEEAAFALAELGAEAHCPALDRIATAPPTAILILLDGLGTDAEQALRHAKASGTPIIALKEGHGQTAGTQIVEIADTVTNDFVSALYLAAWAAMDGSPPPVVPS
ncbi:hypothetical protein PO002_41390 [Cupriavidus necator]|uniref:hypothetical protein n=1 Tax=Cupriavidus necator TaxID=106590 RepID=UPI0039C0E878